MKLFKTAEAMAAEISAMQTDDGPRREDRATVSNFFNGAPPLSDEEAREMGLSVNVNNLFGYTELDQAKEQTMALLNQPPRLLEMAIDRCPASKRTEWEMTANKALNKIIKASGRLKPEYEGVSGDSIMHGLGTFFMPNNTDWCPRQVSTARLLVPSSAPANPKKLTHFAIESNLELWEIFKYYRSEAEGWKKEALGKTIKAFRNAKREDDSTIGETLDQANIEEAEYQRETNSGKSSLWRIGVQTYYFFQIDPEKVTRPVDLTILSRFKQPDSGKQSDAKNGDQVHEILFEREAYYPAIDDVLHPFFMDTVIGGSSYWHRVMGLGTLNYSLNWAVEMLMNRAMQATGENLMTLWQASDSADRETLQQVLLRHNMIVPEGVTLAPNRIPLDLNGALAMIQQYRSQGSKNAMASATNAPITPPRGGRQLEAQFMAEQAQVSAAQGNRTANWYDYFDRLGAKIVERFTNPFITKHDAGYSEILQFQSAMQAAGIPLYYLQPHNIEVKVSRVLGAGNRTKAQQTSDRLKASLQTLPPAGKQKAQRMILAIDLDDYGLAEDLIPIQDHPDTSQQQRALNEENTAIVQGKAPPVNDDDIDALHVDSHFKSMMGIAQKAAQSQAFTPEQHQGYMALGGHIAAHIQKTEAMGDKATAKAWMDQLNKFAAAGDKLAHNMQQQQPEGPQMDPKDQASLQLKAQQLQLQEAKFHHGVDKFQRTQQLREHQAAVSTHVALTRENREDRRTRQEMAAQDIQTADGVRNSRHKRQLDMLRGAGARS